MLVRQVSKEFWRFINQFLKFPATGRAEAYAARAGDVDFHINRKRPQFAFILEGNATGLKQEPDALGDFIRENSDPTFTR